eukprot:1151849-Pelagomonas_calceolata.AAC.6
MQIPCSTKRKAKALPTSNKNEEAHWLKRAPNTTCKVSSTTKLRNRMGYWEGNWRYPAPAPGYGKYFCFQQRAE